ncbi:MAG: inorganic polyphosphate/ATP-NAD kinase [Actinomycetota bacterium]|jgi:NAD+ kinase
MSRIGIAVHRFRTDAPEIARNIASWAHVHGISTVIDEADAKVIASDLTISGDVGDVDLLVAIGGDGTMLRAVRTLAGRCVPVIGVNLGVLGYLAAVEQDDVIDALDLWRTGTQGKDFHYDDRMLLEVAMWSNGARLANLLALNEVVIEKREAGHTVRLGVDIDKAPFTTYAADGLILATPTGSTAYSMSARGPILSPLLRAILMTPVSPHMLFDRSMVLDARELVRIEVLGHRQVNVATDGDLVHTLHPGDVIEVSAAEEVARFVRFEEQRFHQILKTKFGLSDR